MNAKRSVNACVGLWVQTDQFAWTLRSTSEECDPDMGDFWCKNRAHGLSSVVDYYYRTRLNPGGVTMRAIHDLILDTERVRLAMIYRGMLQKGVARRDVILCNTDCVTFLPRKRKAKCGFFVDTSFADLKRARGIARIASCGISSTESTEKVFRCEPTEKRMLGGQYRLPVRDKKPIALVDRGWKIVDATEALGRNEGCMLHGPPGVGKSYLCRQLVEMLRALGETCVLCAKTHVASKNLGPAAVTLDHFIWKFLYGTCRATWIVIDEISMCSVAELNFLQRLKHDQKRFLLLGDLFQHGPIGGHVHCGNILSDDCVRSSQILQILSDNNLMELRENKRSDQALYDFYTSIIWTHMETPLEELIASAKAKYPRQPGWPSISLVIPHVERQRINRAQNEATKPPHAVLLEGADGPAWWYPSIRLVAHLQGTSRGIMNAAFYTVLALDECKVRVFCELTKRELDLPLEFAKAKLRLSFACTQADCHGATLNHGNGRVRVHTGHPKFSKTALYVCVSRCTSSSLLEVV